MKKSFEYAMSDMLRRFILTLAILQALPLQPSTASSETVKPSLQMEGSAPAHTFLTHYNTNINRNRSETLTNLRSNNWLPILRVWADTSRNYIENFAAESHERDEKTVFSPGLVERIRQSQGKTYTESPSTKLHTGRKHLLNRIPQRSHRGVFYFTSQAPASGGLFRFIKIGVNEGSSSVVDEDKICDDENRNDGSKLADRSECKLERNASKPRRRSKRESRNGDGKHKRDLSVPIRLFDTMLKLPASLEEHNLENSFNDDDIFMRTARDRLNRMPITFGKREEDDMDQYFRSERDRLSRMPVTFGKRGTSDRFNTLLTRMFEHILSQHFLELDKYDKSDGASDDSDFFIRISKGSLHRMPLSFGKRAKALSNSNDGEESYLIPVPYAKSTSITEYDNVRNTERSYISPFLWDQQISGKVALHEQSQLQLPENEDFSRLQRSKLERMPLAFGKRHHMSDDIKMGLNFHNIKQRSRLDRMPVTYGKRVPKDLSTVYLSRLNQIFSTGRNDALRSGDGEVVQDLLFESSTPTDIT